MTLQVARIPVLSDNYVWLAHDPASGETAVIDPAVAEPVLAAIAAAGRRGLHVPMLSPSAAWWSVVPWCHVLLRARRGMMAPCCRGVLI
jgi:hypothetical protein